MIPVLYKATETDFTTNGVGNLTDALKCEVYEERNGRFELTLGYPYNGIHANLIDEDMIIKAKANDKDGEQLFRLVSSKKKIDNSTVWTGEHISYDAVYLPVRQPSIANKTAQKAIEHLLELTPLEHNFTAYSNIETTNTTTIDTVVSVRSALGGVEGSIVDTYGGEYRFDNYNIQLLKERGVDSGVEIRYGKNLVDANMEKNIADVTTAIYPYATYYKDDGKAVLVTLDEQILYAPNASKYSKIRCLPYDFTYHFDGGEITQIMLRKVATEYVNSGIDEPAVSINVDFVNMPEYTEDEGIQLLETVGLCDTVGVYIDKLDLNIKAKVVAYWYDVLSEKYNKIQIGSFRNNLARELSGTEKVLNASLEDTKRKILLKVEKGTVSNQLSIEEDGIEISGNRIAINSDNFTLTPEGKMKTVEGEFEGSIVSDSAIITGGSFDVIGEHINDTKISAKTGNGNFFTNISPGQMVLCGTDGFSITLQTLVGLGFGIEISDSGNTRELHLEPYGMYINDPTSNPFSILTSVTDEAILTNGDIMCEGDILCNGTKSRLVGTADYNKRLLYCYETPTPYFGDIGEGTTDESGTCYIFLDDVFAETVNSECDYQVFLQSYGNGNLYIAERTPLFFVVKGTPNLSFGWEIKVVQKDYETYRLDEFEIDNTEDVDYATETYNYLASTLYDAEKESEEITYV